MSNRRDRRFESARRKLHARLAIMEFEHNRHRAVMHEGFRNSECVCCRAYTERCQMLREIIREFGGRA